MFIRGGCVYFAALLQSAYVDAININKELKYNMSIISRIRNNAGLAVIIIAGALLAFIVGDAINNNVGIFKSQDNSMAIINGHKVEFKEYDARTDYEARLMAFKQSPDKPEEPTTQMREQAQNQVWNDLQDEYTYNSDMEKLGLEKLSGQELAEILRDEKRPAREMQQLFGQQFSAAMVTQYYKMQGNIPDDKNGKISNMLELAKRDVEKRRRMEKYNNFMRSIIYVSSLEAKDLWSSHQRSANFKVVALKFNTVSDSSVKITDEDRQKWYNENAYKFQNNDEAREIKYAAFDILPSSADSLEAKKQFDEFWIKLSTTNNDSGFRALAATYNLDTNYYGKNAYPNPMIGDSMFNGQVGRTIGPNLEGGAFKVYKLVGTKQDSTYSIKLRHLLINWKKNKDKIDTAATMHVIDSLVAQLKKGIDFALLANANTEDPGNREQTGAQKGGFYDWTNEKQYAPEFAKTARTTPLGQWGVSKTQFGIHIVKPEDRTNHMIKVASFEVKIEAGKETQMAAEKKAEEFRNSVKVAEDFEKSAGKTGSVLQTVQVSPSQRDVPGIPESKSLLGWTFKGKKGDISDVQLYGNRQVVAIITTIKEKGIPKMEDIKAIVDQETIKMKKAEEFRKRMEAAKAKTKGTVDLAIELKTVDQSAENQTFDNNNIAALGPEPKLLGAVFGTPAGQFTEIVEGNQGVYIAFVEKFTEATSVPKDFKAEQKEISMRLKNSSEYILKAAMKQKADITDRRYLVY